MIKGFKDFVLRGNVVDLAVAVVIGAAFEVPSSARSFTGHIIQPIINSIQGRAPRPGSGSSLRVAQRSNRPTSTSRR